jgi:hypothetical protein
MNVFRISTIAIAHEWYGLDWSSGASHEILGLIIFTFTFLALISTDYLLLALLAPIATRDGMPLGEDLTYGAKLVAVWDWLQRWGAEQPWSDEHGAAPAARTFSLSSRFALGIVGLVLFTTLGGAQLVINRLYEPTYAKSERSVERALTLDHEDLQFSMEGIHQTDFQTQERDEFSDFGRYSSIYEFKDQAGTVYLVSCDFPFATGWHDLTICYTGVGWSLSKYPNVTAATGSNEASWKYAEADFTRPDGNVALVVYSVFDETGRGLNPPSHSIFDDIWRSLEKQYRHSRTEKQFQIQVFTTAEGNITDAQRATARKLLFLAREQFREFISSVSPNRKLASR